MQGVTCFTHENAEKTQKLYIVICSTFILLLETYLAIVQKQMLFKNVMRNALLKDFLNLRVPNLYQKNNYVCITGYFYLLA